MSVLIDTNVLLRRSQLDHPHHQVAVGSVDRLPASREPVHLTPQNIAEFWNVATRPAEHNGLGFTVARLRCGHCGSGDISTIVDSHRETPGERWEGSSDA